MNKKLLVSIVIPVYNIQEYLERCIDSIVNQDYHNWELLLVDDGSTDNSGEICDNYARQYANIRVFHKANGGVSSARNLALSNARGSWISFVDGDDWVRSDYLSNMISAVTDDDILIMHELCFCYKDRTELPPNIKGYLKRDAALLDMFITEKMWFCMGKLIHIDVIRKNSIRFNENITHYEDLLFCMNCLQYVKGVQFVISYSYFYNQFFRIRPSRGMSFNRYVSLWEDYNALCNSIEAKMDDISVQVQYMNYWLVKLMVLSLYYKKFKNHYSRKERLILLKSIPEEATFVLRKIRNLSILRRDEKLVRYLLANKKYRQFDVFAKVYCLLKGIKTQTKA